MYPSEETYEVSSTIQSISDDIMNTTGVTRPPELDEEPDEGEEASDATTAEGIDSEDVSSAE